MERDTKKPTKEILQRAMRSNERVLYGSIIAIYQNQVVDERKSGCTQFANKRGFNKPDAYRMSYFARLILAGCTLSSAQLREAQDRMAKYAGQVATLGWAAVYRELDRIKK